MKYENVLREPTQCFSKNNLDYEDHRESLGDIERTFAPYHILPERLPGVFLGFDKKLAGGPISILFNLQEPLSSQDVKVHWFYWNGDSWVFLNVRDSTRNLTQIGLLEFAVPNDFHTLELFDKALFWIQGSVAEGDFTQKPKLFSIWVNSTYATQASVVEDEILGSSQAVAHQEFPLLNPMIINQAVFVLETTRPSEEERQAILTEEGADAIAEQKDESGEVQHFKIRWHEVDDFDHSGPKDRHYTVDKRLGVIKFGDGVHGMIPPPGADNIRANYRFGGGTNGNVEAGKIASLKNAIPFVDQVTNHLPAAGGSATETLDEVRIRGPLTLKHRERAISPSDFEALAKSASRTVVRAKCLANTNEDGEPAPGHVSVIIVPANQRTNEPPGRILRNIVSDYLQARTANTLGTDARLHVRGATYIEITVEPTIIPTTLEAAVGVEDAVIKTLQRYIHPLTGGPCGDGWAFGATVCRTELFALLEGIEDVDHVQDIVMRVTGEVQAGDVVMGPEQLPFSGEHQVNIQSLGASPNRAVKPLDSTCSDVAMG
jgi:predicted phage baseplate assembly protein